MSEGQARHKMPPVSAGLAREAAGLGLEILRLPGGLALIEPGLSPPKKERLLATLAIELNRRENSGTRPGRTSRTEDDRPTEQFCMVTDLERHQLFSIFQKEL